LIMTDKPSVRTFGKRQPTRLPDTPPPKRSNHVALLVMGTLAVGGGAYAMMGSESCQPASPASPGMAASALPQTSTTCTSHGWSGGSGGYSRSSRVSFFGGPADSVSGGVTRGGFGSLARAFGFSGRS